MSSKELQNSYIHMYENIRNYIWGFDTVERLANLEIAIYSAFPNVADVQKSFNELYIDIKPMFEDDEELAESVEEFKSKLENLDDNFYFKLNQVQEVI